MHCVLGYLALPRNPIVVYSQDAQAVEFCPGCQDVVLRLQTDWFCLAANRTDKIVACTYERRSQILNENAVFSSRREPEPPSLGSKGITDPHVGDAYTFVGIERNTKLILAWHLGQRDMPDTEVFTEKLNRATSGHFQLSTDGWVGYPGAVSYSLGTRVDFAQLIKVYAGRSGRRAKVFPVRNCGDYNETLNRSA